MAATQPLYVHEACWREWFEACTIGNCGKESADRLAAFGRARLHEALRAYSPETAQLYCGSGGRNPSGAWLKIEQYLYGGTDGMRSRAGKAYKDRLIQSAHDHAHFEGLLSLKIRREITRWILAEEGFDIAQKTDAETGRRRFSVTRKANIGEVFDDERSQLDGSYVEPAEVEDDTAVQQAAAVQAAAFWSSLAAPARAAQRLLLACYLYGIFDLKRLLTSGLVTCKQSQLYNERRKMLFSLETLNWGRDCTTPSGRAYMTRRMLPELKVCCAQWLLAVENETVRHFIETAESVDRQ